MAADWRGFEDHLQLSARRAADSGPRKLRITRGYDEVIPALRHLVAAARRERDETKRPRTADDAQLASDTKHTDALRGA